MRSSSLLLAAALAFCAVDARAYWVREEWFGFQPELGGYRARALDLAVYDSNYGLGVGTTGLEVVGGAWDVPRAGSSDASGHVVYELFPLKAYLALASWKGPPYFHILDSRAADRSIGKVELYGSYCGWAQMSDFTQFNPNDPENQGREAVAGGASIRVIDYGVRVDQGVGESFALAGSIGRLEMNTSDDGAFRSKSFGRWYAAVDFYFGTTSGTDYGGGADRAFLGAWDWLSSIFGGSVVHREPLSSTSDE
jgi:hypothetical protein